MACIRFAKPHHERFFTKIDKQLRSKGRVRVFDLRLGQTHMGVQHANLFRAYGSFLGALSFAIALFSGHQ